MMFLKEKKLRFSLKPEDKEVFDVIWSQYKQVIEMESKLDERYKESFKEAYWGLAYEFFLLGIESEALECVRKVPLSKYSSLAEEMRDNEIFLAVGLVVYHKIKDNEEFNKNYFFQIFETKLKIFNIKFPQKEQLHFPEFINAWEDVFGPLKRTKEVIIDGQGNVSGKIRFSSDQE